MNSEKFFSSRASLITLIAACAVVVISVVIYSDTALDEEYIKSSTEIGVVKAVNSTSFNDRVSGEYHSIETTSTRSTNLRKLIPLICT